MKKILTFAFSAAIAFSAQAQNQAISIEEAGQQNTSVPVELSISKPVSGIQLTGGGQFTIDTLDQYMQRTSNLAVYTYTENNNQYVMTGTNTRYIFIGNSYSFNGYAEVEGVLALYAYKRIRGNADNQSVLVFHTQNGLPSGTTRGVQAFSTNTIDTGSAALTYIPFNSVVNVQQDFAVMLQVNNSGAAGDTTDIVYLYSNTHGDGNREERAVALRPGQQQGSFAPVKLASQFNIGGAGIDIDLMIFPVLRKAPTSTEPIKINSLNVNGVYPNPAVEYTNLSIGLEKNENVVINLLDLNGRIISEVHNGAMPAGEHEVRINTSNLAAGNYFYTISAGSAKMAGKLIVK